MARKKIYEKSYAEIDCLLAAWYKSLCSRDSLCIAISRKAPRLLEWCSKKFYESPTLDIVSEIAIPFIDLSAVRTCSLVDEAIYHGTTYSKIFKLITHRYPNINVLAIPLVVTEEALDFLSSSKVYVENYTPMITEGYSHFFIDTVIKRFHNGLKPYDMEFPLIYIKLDRSVDCKYMQESLEKLEKLEEEQFGITIKGCHYKTETYIREDNKISTSFTYVFEYRFDENLDMSRKPDFAKLRFTFKDDTVCIAVMTPYVISDYDINTEGRIFTGEFKSVWNRIYSAVSKSGNEDEEYIYQCKKSLVVMANYLLSLNNFMLLKVNILKAFGGTEARVDRSDLKYLIGTELSRDIVSQINNMASPMPTMNVFGLSGSLVNNYIPYAFKEEYQRKLAFQNLLSSNLSEKISNLFSVMHWEVEVKSRIQTPDTYYSRLRFGESYDSLMEIFKFADCSNKGLRMDIHRNIDLRIDVGSVVPNYVRIERLPNYWLRLFRSGENEDVDRDQFNRILIYMVKQYLKCSGRDTMPLIAVQMALLLMVYEDLGKYSRFFCHKVDFYIVDGVVRPIVEIEDKKMDILDMMTMHGLFDITGQDSIFIKESPYNLRLLDGNALPDDIEMKIKDIVSFVYDYCANIAEWDIMKIMDVFVLLAFNREKVKNEVEKWVCSIKDKVSADVVIDMNHEKMEFVRLLTSMPSMIIPDLKKDNGLWYSRVKKLSYEYDSHSAENSDCESRLLRDVYVLNIWSKLNNFGSDSWIDSEEHKSQYMSNFLPSERETLAVIDQMPADKAKAAVLKMIR